jgi:hypothetical protein
MQPNPANMLAQWTANGCVQVHGCMNRVCCCCASCADPAIDSDQSHHMNVNGVVEPGISQVRLTRSGSMKQVAAHCIPVLLDVLLG